MFEVRVAGHTVIAHAGGYQSAVQTARYYAIKYRTYVEVVRHDKILDRYLHINGQAKRCGPHDHLPLEMELKRGVW